VVCSDNVLILHHFWNATTFMVYTTAYNPEKFFSFNITIEIKGNRCFPILCIRAIFPVERDRNLLSIQPNWQQTHIALITVMFCFNEFAFTTQFKQYVSSWLYFYMFVFYDWPHLHMCTLQHVHIIWLSNSWLSFKWLCRLLQWWLLQLQTGQHLWILPLSKVKRAFFTAKALQHKRHL